MVAIDIAPLVYRKNEFYIHADCIMPGTQMVCATSRTREMAPLTRTLSRAPPIAGPKAENPHA